MLNWIGRNGTDLLFICVYLKMFLEIIYLIYMKKYDLALNKE